MTYRDLTTVAVIAGLGFSGWLLSLIFGRVPFLSILIGTVPLLLCGYIATLLWMRTHTPTTRWRIRYHLTANTSDAAGRYLDENLRFLARICRIITIEAQPTGLYVEVPTPLREYAHKLLTETFPQCRLLHIRAATAHVTTTATDTVIWEDLASTPTLGSRWPFLAQFPPLAKLPLPSWLQRPATSTNTIPTATAPEPATLWLAGPHITTAILIDILDWGIRHPTSTVRVQIIHSHRGLLLAVAVSTAAPAPAGDWHRCPPQLPPVLRAAAQTWPIGIPLPPELSLHQLFPPTTTPSVYSADSELLHIPLPDTYHPITGYRALGTRQVVAQSTILSVPFTTPVWSLNAPPAFLAGQIGYAAAKGYPTIVLSPHRGVLHTVQQTLAAQTRPALLIDLAAAESCARVPIMTLDELTHPTMSEPGLMMTALLEFLAEYDIDAGKPHLQDFARYMLLAGLMIAAKEQRDFSYIHFLSSVWGVNRLTYTLTQHADLWAGAPAGRFQGAIPYLQNLLATLNQPEVRHQLVAYTNALRSIIGPIWTLRTLNRIATGPFTSFSQTLLSNGLIGCVLATTDYPDIDRLLRGMCEATLLRVIRTTRKPVCVFLHSPARYATQTSLERWLSLQRAGLVHLMIDSQESDWFSPDQRIFQPTPLARYTAAQIPTKILFACAEPLAQHVATWQPEWPPAALIELTEFPAQLGLAWLPDNQHNYFLTPLEVRA